MTTTRSANAADSSSVNTFFHIADQVSGECMKLSLMGVKRLQLLCTTKFAKELRSLTHYRELVPSSLLSVSRRESCQALVS